LVSFTPGSHQQFRRRFFSSWRMWLNEWHAKDLEMYLGRKRDSILLATSSRIRICQEEKIADNIASVNQALNTMLDNVVWCWKMLDRVWLNCLKFSSSNNQPESCRLSAYAK
jgi:hypothetical protein